MTSWTLPLRRAALAAAALALAPTTACGDDDKKPSDTAADTTVSDTTADVASDAADTTTTDATSDADTGPTDPGAIIMTTMTGRIGVMLDEIPDGPARDRLAASLLVVDDDFWKQRVERQIELTHYRLTFREFYYEEGDKKSLNLPPPSVWKIELDPDGSERTIIDGHDYIAVDYTMTSAILSDTETPIESDPVFAAIGGKTEESFVLPADPELVFQRSGFACMDEAEFPPSSVDGENVGTYYDDGCVADESDVEEPKERCHQTATVEEDCVPAIEAHIGKSESTITFERVAWDEAIAAEYRVTGWTSTTDVDVQPVAEALDHNYIVYKYIAPDDCAVVEKCVGGSGWRRLLRFDAFLKNTGQVDMEIGDVDYFIVSTSGSDTLLGRHNIFEYSACHDHYHFKHYGEFDLDIGDETVVGSKRAFCLETGTRHFNDEHTPTTTKYSGCHFQGLTRGWGDEYGANLDCQWYDITDVDTSAGPVAADIKFLANPDGFLCEGNPVLDNAGNLTFEPTDFKTDDGGPVDKPVCDYLDGWDSNNVASVDTTLPKSGGLITAPCTRGQVGPLRDCGFSGNTPAATCTAGASVTLSCHNDGTTPAVVRFCEQSAALGTGVACVWRDRLASAIVDGGASVDVTLGCPAARDENEPGGSYAQYLAPLIDGDALGNIACTPK